MDFDLNSQQYFWYDQQKYFQYEDPDIQESCYEELIQFVSETIKQKIQILIFLPRDPSKPSKYCDVINKRVKSILKQKHSPATIKQILAKNFKRHIRNLEVRKLKTISRYGNTLGSFQALTEADYIFRSRLSLIDAEIQALESRVRKLKLNEDFIASTKSDRNFQLKNDVDTFFTLGQNVSVSNVSKLDLEVYLRGITWQRELSRKMLKKSIKLKHIHESHRFEIPKNATKILSDIVKEHLQENQNIFTEIYESIEMKLENLIIMNQEQKYALNKILKPFQFHTPINEVELKHRYDRIPIILPLEAQVEKNFKKTFTLFMKSNYVSQKTTQQLLFMTPQLQNLYEALQTYLKKLESPKGLEFDFKAQNFQKYLIELVSLDDNQQLRDSLLEPIPVFQDLKILFKVDDWSNHLTQKESECPYQNYIQDSFKSVCIDLKTQVLLQLLPVSEKDNMNKLISSSVQTILQSVKNQIFNVYENSSFIDMTHEEISLIQINELLLQKKTRLDDASKYPSKKQFKPEVLKQLENLLDECSPQENLLHGLLTIQVTKMRDYKRKILYLINAMNSIERQLTFDLFILRDHKINRDFDLDYLLHVIEQRREKVYSSASKKGDQDYTKLDLFMSQRTLDKTNPQIKLSNVEQNMEENYVQSLRKSFSIGEDLTEIVYDEQYCYDDFDNILIPDVNVIPKGSSNADIKQFILYSNSRKDLKKNLDWLTQMISFYINKYEKLPRIINNMSDIVDRFQCCLDALQFQARYLFAKLRLLQTYQKIYDNLTDPLESYKLLQQILDIKNQIPLLDTKSYYFKDSYDLNIQNLILDRKVLQNLYNFQYQQEIQKTLNLHQSIQKGMFEKFSKKEEVQSQNKVTSTQVKFLKAFKKVVNLNSVKQQNKDVEENQIPKEMQDLYMVKNDMGEVFAEISLLKNQHEVINSSQQNSVLVHTNSAGIYGESIQINNNLEMIPYYIYQGEGFKGSINMVESVFLAFKTFQMGIDSFQKYLNSFKPKSIIGYLSSRISFLNVINQTIQEFDDEKIEPIETCGEISLDKAINGVQQLLSDLVKLRKSEGFSIENQNFIKKYLNYFDVETIEQILQEKVLTNKLHYQDLVISCNLFELLHMRENLIINLWEQNILRKLYKSQIKSLELQASKDNLYEQQKLFLNSTFNSTYQKGKKTQFFSAYFYEIDASMEKEFSKCQVEVLCLPDVIQEFRTFLLYETINKEQLGSMIELWNCRMDRVEQLECQVTCLQDYKVIIENDSIDRKKLKISVDSSRFFKKKFVKIKQALAQSLIEPLFKQKKQILFKQIQEKYDDGEFYIKNHIKVDDLRVYTILCEKQLRNLKQTLIRLLCYDLLYDIESSAIIIQISTTIDDLNSLLNLIPNDQEIFKKGKQHDLEKMLLNDSENYMTNINTNLQQFINNPNNPFYIVSHDELFAYNIQSTELRSHIQRYDISKQQNHFHTQFSNSPVQNTMNLDQLIQKSFKRKVSNTEFLCLNLKTLQIYQILSYMNQLYLYMKSNIRITTITFNQKELFQLKEILLFAKPLDTITHSQQQEDKIYQQNTTTAMMHYEIQEQIKLDSDKSSIIVSQALDQLIEKYRSFYTIKEMFTKFFNNNMKSIYENTKDKNYSLKQYMYFFKISNLALYKRFYIILHMGFMKLMKTKQPSSELVIRSKDFFFQFFSLFKQSRYNLQNINTKFLTTFYNGKDLICSNDLKCIYQNHKSFKCFKQQNQDNFSIKNKLKLILLNLPHFYNRKVIDKNQNDDFIISNVGFFYDKYRFIRSQKLNPYGQTELIPQLYNEIKYFCYLSTSDKEQIIKIQQQIDSELEFYLHIYQDQHEGLLKRETTKNQYYDKIIQNHMLINTLLILNNPNNLTQLEYYRNFDEVHKNLQDIIVNKMRQSHQTKIIDMVNTFRISKTEFDQIVPVMRFQGNNETYLEQSFKDALLRDLGKQQIYQVLATQATNLMETQLERISFRTAQINSYTDSFYLSQKSNLQRKMIGGLHTTMPRVKFHEFFSTNLSQNHEGNFQIPPSLKLSFIQSFLNKFKNKSTKLDLISSGVGFMITSNDLEECLNQLNKELVTFAERELHARMDTSAYVFDMLKSHIEKLQYEKLALANELNFLKEEFDSKVQSRVLLKCSDQIFGAQKINQQLQDFKQFTSELEKSIEQKMRKELEQEIQNLKRQNNIIIQQFQDFRNEIITLCKSEVKNHQSAIINFVNQKTIEAINIPILSYVNIHSPHYHVQNLPEQQQPINNSEFDIIEDPYVATVKINKLRQFYLLKMSIMKSKFEQEMLNLKKILSFKKDIEIKYNEQLSQEKILKQELVALQQVLNDTINKKDQLAALNANIESECKQLQRLVEDLSIKLKITKNNIENKETFNQLKNSYDFPPLNLSQNKVDTSKHTNSTKLTHGESILISNQFLKSETNSKMMIMQLQNKVSNMSRIRSHSYGTQKNKPKIFQN